MNKKVFLFSLLVSFLGHALFLFGFSQFDKSKQTHFAKNEGQARVKVSVQLREKVIQKKVEPKKKEKKEISETPKPKPFPLPVAEMETASKAQKMDEQGQQTLVANYLTQVRSQIAKLKYKNRISTKLNLKGTVVLALNIEWPNTLKELKIFDSSGLEPLDESALETVNRISQFPSMPQELENFTLPVKVILIYD